MHAGECRYRYLFFYIENNTIFGQLSFTWLYQLLTGDLALDATPLGFSVIDRNATTLGAYLKWFLENHPFSPFFSLNRIRSASKSALAI